jgi:hypothetical protein
MGFDPRTAQSVASRYTDYVIPAHVLVQLQVINRCHFTVAFVGQHKHFVVKSIFQ